MSDPALGKAVLELSTDDTKLVTGLEAAKSEAAKAVAAVSALTKALSGSRLEQDAKSIVASIQNIGGATKLSDAEAKRYLQTLDEWIQKSQRMGTAIAPEILKTRDALKQVDDAAGKAAGSASKWSSTLTTAAGAFGLTLSVGAVVAFGKSVFDSAGRTHDLAQQLGISTDAVQGFKFAAEQSGSSLDAVGTAITKMNSNLAGGDKATVQALKDAGLGFNAIRAMKPEDAFLAITDAVQQIPDPMVQSRVALQLFGKSAAELLPGIKDGFRGAADGAAKMSEDTINSLEAAGDAWGKLADKVTIVTGTLIAKAMGAAATVTDSWRGFAQFAENVVKFGAGAATAMAAAQDEATKAAGKNRDINLALAPAVHKTAEEIDAAAAAAKKYADAFNAMFGKFSGSAATADMKMLDAVFRKLADSGQLTEQQTAAIVKEALNLTEAGARLTPRLLSVALATDALSPGLSKAKLNFSELGEQIAIEIPKLDAFSLALQKALSPGNLIPTAAPRLGVDVGLPQIPKAPPGTFWGSLFGSPTELGKQLSTTIMGAIQGGGNPVSAAAGLVGSKIGGSIAGSLTKEGGKLFNTALGGIFSSALPVIGSLIGPLTEALWGHFFGTKGRDAVKDFVGTFGGFDAFHAMLAEKLPADAERLWIALTQGVGRNNPAEAKKIIDEITAALEAQKNKTAETAQAAAEAADVQQGALDAITAKYADTIKAIDSEYKSLSDAVAQEAEEDVMGLVETQQRARIKELDDQKKALEAQRDAELESKKATFDDLRKAGEEARQDLQDIFDRDPLRISVILNTPAGGYTVPSPGLILPGGGASSSFAGASASRATVIENRIILDGREIARNQVRHLPNALAGIGVGRR